MVVGVGLLLHISLLGCDPIAPLLSHEDENYDRGDDQYR